MAAHIGTGRVCPGLGRAGLEPETAALHPGAFPLSQRKNVSWFFYFIGQSCPSPTRQTWLEPTWLDQALPGLAWNFPSWPYLAQSSERLASRLGRAWTLGTGLFDVISWLDDNEPIRIKTLFFPKTSRTRFFCFLSPWRLTASENDAWLLCRKRMCPTLYIQYDRVLYTLKYSVIMYLIEATSRVITFGNLSFKYLLIVCTRAVG